MKKLIVSALVLVLGLSTIGFSDSIKKEEDININIYFENQKLAIKELENVKVKFNEEKFHSINDNDKKLYVLRNLVVPIYEAYKDEYTVTWSYKEDVRDSNLKNYIIDIYKEDTEVEKIIQILNDEYSLSLIGLSQYINKTFPDEINNNFEYFRSILEISNKDILKAYSTGRLNIFKDTNISQELSEPEIYGYIKNMFNSKEVLAKDLFTGNNIPILMYHELNPLPSSNFSGLYVSRENFVKQLNYLQKNGFNTISMQQFYDYKNNGSALPEKPIILTFDDGYKSHYFAALELNKRGMTGTFYIIAGDRYFNSPSHVNEAEVKQMHNMGMEIGSHTVTHIDARYSSQSKIKSEYKASKERLESILNDKVNHFCYPIGGNTSYARARLKAEGYQTAVTTVYSNAYLSQNNFLLKRIRMFYSDPVTKLDRLVQ